MKPVCAWIALGLAFASPAIALPAIAAASHAAAPPTAFRLPQDYATLIDAPLQANLDASTRVPGLRRGEFHGFPAWLVETPDATAAISVFGGQLLSYVPRGGQDVFWLSPTTRKPPAPTRGGTPVCWPYFGKTGQASNMPPHGLVRTMPWRLTGARRDADGSVLLQLAPPSFDELPLRLTMELRIGRTLVQTLLTENIGSQPVVFTQALHNYFRVSDVREVTVSGLDSRSYVNKKEPAHILQQRGDWRLPPQGYSDRIYANTTGPYVLHDGGFRRSIRINTRGSRSAVVWNAGEQAARGIADIGEGWRHYLSVETTNVAADAVELQPGERHELQQVIEVDGLK